MGAVGSPSRGQFAFFPPRTRCFSLGLSCSRSNHTRNTRQSTPSLSTTSNAPSSLLPLSPSTFPSPARLSLPSTLDSLRLFPLPPSHARIPATFRPRCRNSPRLAPRPPPLRFLLRPHHDHQCKREDVLLRPRRQARREGSSRPFLVAFPCVLVDPVVLPSTGWILLCRQSLLPVDQHWQLLRSTAMS
jgi:hypothetical protein